MAGMVLYAFLEARDSRKRFKSATLWYWRHLVVGSVLFLFWVITIISRETNRLISETEKRKSKAETVIYLTNVI